MPAAQDPPFQTALAVRPTRWWSTASASATRLQATTTSPAPAPQIAPHFTATPSPTPVLAPALGPTPLDSIIAACCNASLAVLLDTTRIILIAFARAAATFPALLIQQATITCMEEPIGFAIIPVPMALSEILNLDLALGLVPLTIAALMMVISLLETSATKSVREVFLLTSPNAPVDRIALQGTSRTM